MTLTCLSKFLWPVVKVCLYYCRLCKIGEPTQWKLGILTYSIYKADKSLNLLQILKNISKCYHNLTKITSLTCFPLTAMSWCEICDINKIDVIINYTVDYNVLWQINIVKNVVEIDKREVTKIHINYFVHLWYGNAMETHYIYKFPLYIVFPFIIWMKEHGKNIADENNLVSKI